MIFSYKYLRNFDVFSNFFLQVAVGDDLRRKPYSMASLDNDWYSVLGGIKR